MLAPVSSAAENKANDQQAVDLPAEANDSLIAYSTNVSPRDIMPIPKAALRKRLNRRRGKPGCLQILLFDMRLKKRVTQKRAKSHNNAT